MLVLVKEPMMVVLGKYRLVPGMKGEVLEYN